MLKAILQRLTLTCGHQHVGWPQYNRQRCLDCGGTRYYDLQREIRREWISPERPYSEAQLQHATTVPGKKVAVANIRTVYGSISTVSHAAALRTALRAVLLAIAILSCCVVPLAGQSFPADRDFSMRFHRLSFLLTADREKAEHCIVYGLEDSVKGNPVFKEWASSWAQLAVIKNAVQLIDPRPTEGSRPSSVNSISKELAAEPADIAPVLGLEVFERFVYVLSVLEHYPDQECSILLGCTRRDVVAARIRALQQIGTAKEVHLVGN
jgi:hypothetical protein